MPAGVLTVAINFVILTALLASTMLLAYRGATARPRLSRRSVIIIGTVLFVAFGSVMHQARVIWDGEGYYAQARSLAIDGDLDYQNELRYWPKLWVEKTANGLATPFSFGPALFWIPMFPVAGLVARLSGAPPDGFSWPYLWMVSLMSIAVTAAGIVMTWRASAIESTSEQDSDARLCAAILFVLATGVPIYAWATPSYSHAYQFFASALACWWSWRLWWLVRQPAGREPPAASWMYQPLGAFLSGAILGLCFIVRWQALFMGLVFLGPVWELIRRRALSWAAWAKVSIAAAAGFLIVASIQIAVLRATWGPRWTYPAPLLSPATTEYSGILFSTYNSLFAYHPVLFIGVAAMVALARRRDYRVFVAGIALWMLTELRACASLLDWWSPEGFGHRRLLSYVPWLAALSAVWIFGSERRSGLVESRRVFMGALAVFVVWNFLFAGAWSNYRIRHNMPFPYGMYDYLSFAQTALNEAYNFVYTLLKEPLVEGT